MVLGRGVVLGALLTALAGPARAQEPSGGPPPAGEETLAGVGVHELLPGIGKLGAQVGLSLGASWNPYDVGQGLVGAAFVDLPILRAPGGKLNSPTQG